MFITMKDAGGILVGLGALLGIGYLFKRDDDIHRQIDMSVSEVMKRTPVEVSDSIINRAVEKAVDREVHERAKQAARNVRDEMNRAIRD